MKNKEFWIRLRSSAVILLVSAMGLYFGGLTLFLLIAVTSAIGMFELYRAGDIWPGGISAAGLVGGALILEAVWLGWDSWLMFALCLAVMLIMGTYIFSFPRYDFIKTALSIFGVIYIPLMLSYVYRVRSLEEGSVLVWLIFLASSGSDVMAYCTGLLFGRHKLAPQLSPKKSVEGAIGGVLGTALLGMVFGLCLKNSLNGFTHPVLFCTILCGAGSIISQLGDLAASAIKRNCGIKDYSQLIPGHGGILDRLDSIIPTAPIIYYLIILLYHPV